jgi:hypothetical protein
MVKPPGYLHITIPQESEDLMERTLVKIIQNVGEIVLVTIELVVTVLNIMINYSYKPVKPFETEPVWTGRFISTYRNMVLFNCLIRNTLIAGSHRNEKYTSSTG